MNLYNYNTLMFPRTIFDCVVREPTTRHTADMPVMSNDRGVLGAGGFGWAVLAVSK